MSNQHCYVSAYHHIHTFFLEQYFLNNLLFLFTLPKILFHLNRVLQILREENLLRSSTIQEIETAENDRLFSVFWHIKTFLYVGVLLLVTGLGFLIYKNIDTIGHITIVVLIGLVSLICFIYCFKKAEPFSVQKSQSPGIGFDYILLLGCLLLLTFLGYLQWQYKIFGVRYGLATFFPAIVLLAAAYRFDHLGVLTLGITLFSSWLGLTITPLDLLEKNDFSSFRIIYTGVALAIIFAVSSFLHRKYEVKNHFSFTYINFASHLAGISCLAGVFNLNGAVIFLPLLAFSVFLIHRYAISQQSFYLVLVALFYGYIGASYLFFKLIQVLPEIISIYGGLACFIFSSLFLIRYLKGIKKSFSKNDHIQ